MAIVGSQSTIFIQSDCMTAIDFHQMDEYVYDQKGYEWQDDYLLAEV